MRRDLGGARMLNLRGRGAGVPQVLPFFLRSCIRCFRELCRLVTSPRPTSSSASTLQLGLGLLVATFFVHFISAIEPEEKDICCRAPAVAFVRYVLADA